MKLSDKRMAIAKLERALQVAAEEAYHDEIIATDSEKRKVGEGKEFSSREDWIEQKIEEWIEAEEQER